MKKVITLAAISFLLFNTAVYAQTVADNGNNSGGSATTKDGKKFQTKWKIDPFNDHVFIENNGQYDGIIKSGEKVLYSATLGNINIYFTNNKIVYRYEKNYFKKPAEAHADPDDPKYARHELYFVNAEWQGASKAVSVEGKDELKSFYAFGIDPKGSIKANGYKELIYKNLYPGIDAVFQFIDGKTGLKYALVVHPGADLSNIKLSYSGAKSITKNKEGDILIHSDLDLLTEHAPVTNYMGELGNIAFSNVITGNTESFKANENYDKSKTIVIDPWITDPLFTTYDKAYDLDWDYAGNVYAYGGNPGARLQLVKINGAGAIQWTYQVASNWGGSYYGDLCVDKNLGITYLVQGYNGITGAQCEKVNTSGTLLSTYHGTPQMAEMWRADYDACNGDIVIGGGGTRGTHQAGVIDTDMMSMDSVNIMSASNPYHDVTLEAIDPDGTECYMASAHTYEDNTNNNSIMQLPLPTLAPTVYNVHENLGFDEVGSITYVGGGGGETNAMNGAAASPNWLYLYNGDTLSRYHKNTGAITTQHSIRLHSPYQYGGLAVDACDDIFVGVQDSIYIFDSTFAITTKIPFPALNVVYDLQLGQKNALYACGDGFVTELTNPVTPTLISSAAGTPTSCSVCNGKATVNVNCGIAPYSFTWNDGSTNQTDTGLCAGVYTVTVKDAACPPRIDTATVTITGEAGFSATTIDTNPNCGIRKGSAYARVVGGNPPYTFSWSNGSTNQKDTGLIAGSYTCIITDNIGCKVRVSLTLINPSAPNVKVAPTLDSICSGGSIGLVASGAKTYSWLPASSGLTCYNCPNPTASPTSTVTYTVTGTDSNGCTNVATTTVKVKPAPSPVITGPDTACVGSNVTLSATGGGTYSWAPGGATTSFISFIASTTQTYTVFVSNGACSGSSTFLLTVVPAATASINASKDTICSGDTLTLEGHTGLKYRWSNGATTANIHISPLTTTTYTLYTTSGTCKDSTTITVPTYPVMTAAARTNLDSICPGGSATLTVTSSGGGGANTYLWNPGGGNTSSISVSPTITTTYTVIVTGRCGTLQRTVTVVVVPVPQPVISGTNWKCRGVRDTLTVGNLNGPATYVWSNGKTTTSIYTGLIDGDSTISVTAYNKLGCSHDTTFSITLRVPLTITLPPPPLFCAGQNVCISADVSGNPLSPVSYLWTPGGGTTSTICVTPDSTTAYVVTVSNGCKSTKATTLSPDYPNLNSCCSQTISRINDTITPSTVIMVASGNSVSYSWTPSVTCLDPPLCDKVKAEPTPSVTTVYTVTGTDANGCSIQSYVVITVDVPCFNLTIPNVLTPTNGGTLGLDKVFYIDTRNISGWSITIFDRWGKTMFSTTDQYKYWDGNTASGGPAPAGVYYYIISGTCQNTTYKRDGFLQLIR